MSKSLPQRNTFTVSPDLLRDVMAAVAFLFADALPEDAYAILTDPSERTFDALSRLVQIRQEAFRA